MQTEPQEWEQNADYAIRSKFEKCAKNHRREYDSVFINLAKIIKLLNSGNKLGAIRINFFRSEGDEVYRIGQTAVPAAKETRLYVYPDVTNRIMYVLSIGTKDGVTQQQADINEAKELVEKIRTIPPTQPLPPAK